MQITPRAFWGGIILLALAVAVFSGVVLKAYRVTSQVSVNAVSGISPAKVSPKKVENIALTVTSYPKTVARGGRWVVAARTNPTARCMAEVYRPDGSGEPTMPGRLPLGVLSGGVSWSWIVPKDAVPGRWTVRLFCGNDDMVASADVPVEVQ